MTALATRDQTEAFLVELDAFARCIFPDGPEFYEYYENDTIGAEIPTSDLPREAIEHLEDTGPVFDTVYVEPSRSFDEEHRPVLYGTVAGSLLISRHITGSDNPLRYDVDHDTSDGSPRLRWWVPTPELVTKLSAADVLSADDLLAVRAGRVGVIDLLARGHEGTPEAECAKDGQAMGVVLESYRHHEGLDVVTEREAAALLKLLGKLARK